jgi:hypothetical protein
MSGDCNANQPERLIRQTDYWKEIGVNKNTLAQWIRAGLPTVGRLIPVDRANEWRRVHRPRTIAIGRKCSIYFARRESDGAIKIGFSSDVPRRLIELRKKTKCRVSLLGSTSGGSAVERRLHRRFAHLHLDGEWFHPGDDLLAFVRRLKTPEVQAEMVERDYRFHTLNESQRAAFETILTGKRLKHGDLTTRTLQSLEGRGLICPVPGRLTAYAAGAFTVPAEVRAAWAKWNARSTRSAAFVPRSVDVARGKVRVPTLPPACPVGEPAAGEAPPGGAAAPEPVGGQPGALAAAGQANPVGERPGC